MDRGHSCASSRCSIHISAPDTFHGKSNVGESPSSSPQLHALLRGHSPPAAPTSRQGWGGPAGARAHPEFPAEPVPCPWQGAARAEHPHEWHPPSWGHVPCCGHSTGSGPHRGRRAGRVPGRVRASRLAVGTLLSHAACTEPSCATSTPLRHQGLCPGTRTAALSCHPRGPKGSVQNAQKGGCGCGMPAWHHSSSTSSHHPGSTAESTTGHLCTGAWSCSARDTHGQELRWHCPTGCS